MLKLESYPPVYSILHWEQENEAGTESCHLWEIFNLLTNFRRIVPNEEKIKMRGKCGGALPRAVVLGTGAPREPASYDCREGFCRALWLRMETFVHAILAKAFSIKPKLGVPTNCVDIAQKQQQTNEVDTAFYQFQVLEEDSVQLSTIKASKFYNSFAEKIDKWEKALNGVSETVDLILNVQKKWMYLESIFMASEDICKQLPRESAIFMEASVYSAKIEG